MKKKVKFYTIEEVMGNGYYKTICFVEFEELAKAICKKYGFIYEEQEVEIKESEE